MVCCILAVHHWDHGHNEVKKFSACFWRIKYIVFDSVDKTYVSIRSPAAVDYLLNFTQLNKYSTIIMPVQILKNDYIIFLLFKK